MKDLDIHEIKNKALFEEYLCKLFYYLEPEIHGNEVRFKRDITTDEWRLFKEIVRLCHLSQQTTD